ncbi:MAG: hypothetical protein F6K55_14965 [Moorea sp. SIO4A3]|nr:hypothetical protein [Moorena sp. SIO4A3]
MGRWGDGEMGRFVLRVIISTSYYSLFSCLERESLKSKGSHCLNVVKNGGDEGVQWALPRQRRWQSYWTFW